MSLMPWDVDDEIRSIRDEMNRMFNEAFSQLPSALTGRREAVWSPAIDVCQTDDAFIVEVELPGTKEEDFNLNLTKDTLKISGEIKAPEAQENVSYLRRERHRGKFSRTIVLPVEIDADKAKAIYKNGILQITLPKAEEVKPRTIQIEVE